MADLNKKRRPNFTDEEILAMIEAVKERRMEILSKFDSKITAKCKNMAWEAVTRQVNIASRVQRDATEVRKKFSDFRALVKKKAAAGKKHSGGTGGGPAVPVNFTHCEEAMLPLIELDAIHGLPGLPDSEEVIEAASADRRALDANTEQQEVLAGMELDPFRDDLNFHVHHLLDNTSVISITPQQYMDLPTTSTCNVLEELAVEGDQEESQDPQPTEQPSTKRKRKRTENTDSGKSLPFEMLDVQRGLASSVDQLVVIFQEMNNSIKMIAEAVKTKESS